MWKGGKRKEESRDKRGSRREGKWRKAWREGTESAQPAGGVFDDEV